MKKILMRIKIAYRVLFCYEHCFIINVTRENLKKSILLEDFHVDGFRCGLQEYNQNYILNRLACQFDDDDLFLMRAEFEASAEYLSQSKLSQRI